MELLYLRNKMKSIAYIVLVLFFAGCIKTNQDDRMTDSKANLLIKETSPYLLQHAYNPVNWHAWNDETLAKAKRENKMLIVSIGYAACHWCHVMEHESFEDSTVAAIMNEHFLPIKVDREERPDIDDIYMTACNLVSGRGGWPLNAFALPDGRPFWAGTYFPRDQWLNVLDQFVKMNSDDPDRIVSSADQLTKGINSQDQLVIQEKTDLSPEDLQDISQRFVKQIDAIYGGRRGAPKFPMPNNYNYLMRYGLLADDAGAIEAVATTLDQMSRGGIYDQIGGGFARYSVDSIWLAPHFEKMLYDNGQLVSLYSQAYRLTKNESYAYIIRQTLEWVEREMTSDEFGFYSSLDADSEGEEGKFYVWSEAEVDSLIVNDFERKVFKDYYDISTLGNWEHTNILRVTEAPSIIAKRYNLNVVELNSIVEKNGKILFDKRQERIRPGLDDKVLTSWNALMISGYVDAYKALGESSYLHIAERTAHFLLKKQMREDGGLNRNYKNGTSSINAFLDDYALLIQAFLDIYEVTFDESWINLSRELTEYTIEHFYNEESKMFFYTSDLDPPLVARKLELSDNVIPASNSIMARMLHRLGELIYDEEYISKSTQMLSNIWPQISQSGQGSFYSNWLQLALDQAYPPFEIAIMGPEATNWSHEMMKDYYPNAWFLGNVGESEMPLLQNKYVEDKSLIYVCQNKTCKLPVAEITEARIQIKN